MTELLLRLTESDLAMLLTIEALIFGVVFLVLGLRVISIIQRRHAQEIASSTVAEMLERGLAPQDIIAVLKAMGLESPPERGHRRLRERLASSSSGSNER